MDKKITRNDREKYLVDIENIGEEQLSMVDESKLDIDVLDIAFSYGEHRSTVISRSR